MKTVRVKYSVTFQATIEVPDDATPREIGEEMANINIPEDDVSEYKYGTFVPEMNDEGDPQLFDEDWNPVLSIPMERQKLQ